jgi:tRNA pseudouridine55 synthase
MLHGWIVLDKPVGIGSTRCVTAVKRALKEADEPKTKVGHGGTLDPLASGVLPIALGEATKLAGRMLDATKAYDFTIRFGEETDTLDAEGKIAATSQIRPTQVDVETVLPRFTGTIKQVPPAYSAIKICGKAAYARARAGEVLRLEARAVTIHSLRVSASPREHNDLTRRRGDAEEVEELTFTAEVSKGTYIRSLARDIARALNTVGHVTMLRRTRAGPFTLDRAISLDKLAEIAKARTLDGAVLPLHAGLDDIPALPVTPEQALLLQHGQRLVGNPATPGLYLALDDNRPVALVEVSAGDVRVVRGFNL